MESILCEQEAETMLKGGSEEDAHRNQKLWFSTLTPEFKGRSTLEMLTNWTQAEIKELVTIHQHDRTANHALFYNHHKLNCTRVVSLERNPG